MHSFEDLKLYKFLPELLVFLKGRASLFSLYYVLVTPFQSKLNNTHIILDNLNFLKVAELSLLKAPRHAKFKLGVSMIHIQLEIIEKV